ncbi:MAG: CGNR zinc finger domain-containing protein [Rhodanobacteraceae bacterium]
MARRRSSPPLKYADLDDFLWRDYDDRAEWTSWVLQRAATEVRNAAREYDLARELQGALRALEDVNSGAKQNASAAIRVDALIARCGVHPATRADGSTRLVASRGAVSDLLVAALTAMTDGSWKRFKRCRDRTCCSSFYDTSKSATRRWCSMDRCGTRAKMRRFRGGA